MGTRGHGVGRPAGLNLARWGLLLGWLAVTAACGTGSTPSTAAGGGAAAVEGQGAADGQGPGAGQGPGEPSQPLAPLAPLSEAERREGWIALFDGATLFGWTPTSEADWAVVEGAISVGRGEKGLLCTTSQFADYVLRLEFRADAATNSGIFLRTPLRPQDPERDCYELNIAPPDNPFPTGSLVKRAKVEGVAPSDTWRTYEVRVEGSRVEVSLDGKSLLSYDDPQPLRRGHIGLQLNEGRVAFRNIRLKPLGSRPLLNGRDLSGWKSYPEMKSEFRVTEAGELHVRNGRGQLETEELFGDFLLQLECRTNAPHLNSGIFFRCVPGETMNGYECQIQNEMQGEDAARPKDCGTGGFFRRQDARRIVARDGEWFRLTLIADGPHMAAWVDGHQVSDWTDEREADANPRKGLRLEPGSIMIQGHDPTTDILFRNLQIAPLP